MIARTAAAMSTVRLARFLALPAGGGTLAAFAATGRRGGMSRRAALEHFERAVMQQTRIHPARALELVEKVLADGRAGRDAWERAVLRRLHAHALRAVGRVRDALPHYAAAARTFQDAAQPLEVGRTVIGWIDALAHAGRVEQALGLAELGRRSLPRRERALRARLQANVGNALYLAGRVSEAQRQFEAARRKLSQLRLTRDAALCEFNLGQAQLLRGRAVDARRSFDSARRIFARRGFTAQALQARASAASAELALGRWGRALAELDGVARQLQAVRHDRAAAAVRREVAEFLVALGAVDAAEPLVADALASFRRMGMALDTARMSFLHARVLAAQGRVGDARARLGHARRQFVALGHRAATLECDVELCALALRRGDAAAALARLRVVRGRRSWIGASGNAARAMAIEAEAELLGGRARRAAARAERAYALAASPVGGADRPWMALLAARAHERAGRPEHALRWARQAAGEAERVARRLGTRALRDQFGDARARLYREAIAIVLRHGGPRAPRQALDLLARARSPRLLEDLLAGAEPLADAQLRFGIARLRNRLLAQPPASPSDVRHRALRREAAALHDRLRAELRKENSARTAFDGALWRWAPRFAGQALVVYEELDSQWGAFVLTPAGRVRWVPLPRAAEAIEEHWGALRLLLEAAAQAPRARRRQLLSETVNEAQADLRALAKALWTPLGIRAPRVVVVPTGELHGVPIEALAAVTTAATQGAGGTLPVVSRLPHPGVVPATGRGRSREALLLRGPGIDADRELAAARGALRRRRFHVRVEERRNALLHRRNPLALLHVAAHGVFHRDHWLMTGIQLQDGWLGFEALQRRWARGALLTFGSCESGLRVDAPQGELDGWLAAGLGAGAHELVLTLWKLDDEAAAAFAENFYPLWSRGVTAPQAAMQAREALRERLAHPYSWAPFIAVG